MLELTVNVGQEEPYDLGTGYNHMALTVDDIHAVLADLEPLGVAPEKPPYHPGDREELPLIAFVADPDGYRIELIDGGSSRRRRIPRLARARTFEPGTMSSRPSGQRTHALWPPS